MSGWDELVAGALVGTARRPPAIPDAEPASALGQVLAGIDPTDPERAVLRAGAVLGLYRQAGLRLPVGTTAAPAASPPEERPYCSDAAASRLDAMLGGRFRPVLPEWLARLAGVGRLVPPDRLPGLLHAASADPGLRVATVDVVGERGRWLATMNPAWAWAGGGPDDTSVWVTGAATARRLLLARRRTDGPAEARALLESTWATETPDDRAAFIAVLVTGLSMEDEPFLEAALDDRRKEVRHAAADLLWRLPGSRLADRMADRSRPLVGPDGEATLPHHVDDAMVRDGIVARPPAGQGERAWWLHQLVAATPLAAWTDAPGRLVGRAGPLLRQAWSVAALRQRDEAWATALLDADDTAPRALLEAVPHDRAVALAAEQVARVGLTPAVLELLGHCPVPWGPELSGLVVARAGEAMKRQGRPDAGAVALRAALGELGVRLHPSVPTTGLQECAPWWFDVVGWLVELLTFRAEMQEELF